MLNAKCDAANKFTAPNVFIGYYVILPRGKYFHVQQEISQIFSSYSSAISQFLEAPHNNRNRE